MWGALWAASTTTKIPYLCASLQIVLISLLSPLTLVISAIEINLVFEVIFSFMSSIFNFSSLESTNTILIFFLADKINHGKILDACSLLDSIISSPSFK